MIPSIGVVSVPRLAKILKHHVEGGHRDGEGPTTNPIAKRPDGAVISAAQDARAVAYRHFAELYLG